MTDHALTPAPPPVDADEWADHRGHLRHLGHHYEWRLADEANSLDAARNGTWFVARNTQHGHRCRYTDAGCRCPELGAAALNRAGTGQPRWWWYCAAHLFGRYLNDGHVWQVALIGVVP